MVSDHLKKIVLSLEFDVLEIALAHPPPPAPRLFAKLNVKMKSFANVRATFFFSVFKKNKGLKIIMSFRCVTEWQPAVLQVDNLILADLGVGA